MGLIGHLSHQQFAQDAAERPSAVGKAFTPESVSRSRAAVRLTCGEIEELGRMYESGQTVRHLVEHFGCHRSTVLSALKRLGITGRRQRRILTDEKAIDAARRFGEGESLAAIGQHYSVDATTIRRELHKLGVSTSR